VVVAPFGIAVRWGGRPCGVAPPGRATLTSGRVCAALTTAWAASHGDEAELAALVWLEQETAPRIAHEGAPSASGGRWARPTAHGVAWRDRLPRGQRLQARRWARWIRVRRAPGCWFSFVWADGAPLRHARALARLAARVGRSCAPVLELRVLVSAWRRARAPSGRPPIGPYPTSHLAGEHVFLRGVGPSPVGRFGLAIAQAVRGAVLRFASDEAPEGITGHRHDGRPSERPHLVIAPIPDVGWPGASGAILGVLLHLPNAAATASRRLHHALEGWRRAGFEVGFRGQTMRLERASDVAPPLRLQEWIGPATDWATATPIALDLNPGNLTSPDPDRQAAAYARAVACVRDSVTRLGLPAPEVSLGLTPPLLGGYAIDGDHPPFPMRADRVRRVQVHAMLHFASPVAGPIVIGAGRYLGLGLCKPLFPG
jgi:hypothetical protein